jgi:hypothetical protein
VADSTSFEEEAILDETPETPGEFFSLWLILLLILGAIFFLFSMSLVWKLP